MTFNRPALVGLAIESVVRQTYEGWRLPVIDNGSDPPVTARPEWLRDPRIRWVRHDENLHGCDVLEAELTKCDGTHLLFLADDDALTPGAFAIVASAIERTGAELIVGSYPAYDHQSGLCAMPLQDGPAIWDGSIEAFDGLEAAMMYCNGWGIGPKRRFRAPAMGHSSSTFVSLDLIRRTRQRQGVLFVKQSCVF